MDPKIKPYGEFPKSPVTLTAVPPAAEPDVGVIDIGVCAIRIDADNTKNSKAATRMRLCTIAS
jgi:hypothetical protein